MTHAVARPVRYRVHDTFLSCGVLRSNGWRGYCACGWKGQWRVEYGLARADANEHNRDHRGRHGAVVT
jgi:hypothetical protein